MCNNRQQNIRNFKIKFQKPIFRNKLNGYIFIFNLILFTKFDVSNLEPQHFTKTASLCLLN